MTKFKDVLNNILIGERSDFELYNRVFVVSAYGGVTNMLLEHKKTGEPGVYEHFINNEDYNKSLQDVLNNLLDINRSHGRFKIES